MAGRNNMSELGKAKKMIQQVSMDHIRGILAKTCDDLIDDAVRSKEYTGFTGNTQTSYSCGLYVNGAFTYYVNQRMWTENPVRKKVPKGMYVYLKRPYEGKPRGVIGRTDVDSLYGKDSAFQFLKSYNGAPTKGLAIVMTTGTEYSVYIEQVRGLNVLTDTFRNAKSILLKNMRPIV